MDARCAPDECAPEILPASNWWLNTGWFSHDPGSSKDLPSFTAVQCSLSKPQAEAQTPAVVYSTATQAAAQSQVKTSTSTSQPQTSIAAYSSWMMADGTTSTPTGSAACCIAGASCAAPDPSSPHRQAAGSAPGGTHAQNRFASKGCMPMYRSVPVDGAPEVAFANSNESSSARGESIIWRSNQETAYKRQLVGRTCDGSVPSEGVGAGHHLSRWEFNIDSWQWQRSDEAKQGVSIAQDKHQLAARRWGDGRDQLYTSTASGGQDQTTENRQMVASPPPHHSKQLQQGPVIHGVTVTRSARHRPGGFNDMPGLHKAKQQLLDAVVIPFRCHKSLQFLGIKCSRGVLLHGAPGTGKTYLAKALAAECGAILVPVNAAEVIGGPEAEEKLVAAFAEAARQQPSVLFVDDVEVLAPSRETAPHMSDIQQQARARFLSLLDSYRKRTPQLMVVAATCAVEAVDPRLRRAGRLDVEVALGALTSAERLEVLQHLTAAVPMAADVRLKAVAQDLQGFVLADCCAVVAEAAIACLRDALEYPDGKVPSSWQGADFRPPLHMELQHRHFMAAIDQVHVPSSLRSWAVEVPKVSWEDVVGLENAKQELREMLTVPLQYPEKLRKYGMKPAGGALLFGPPGCGKTLLAKAAACHCGANFIPVSAPDILDKWLGQTEARVRELFHHARAAAPCVLFFDEMDALARVRGGGENAQVDGGNGAAARLLNQLLVEMDGIQGRGGVFVLGATNRPDVLDPAILRPGRLDHLIEVGLPNQPARLKILQQNFKKVRVHPDINLEDIADSTDGFSAAEVADVCRRALMCVVRADVTAEQQGLSEQQVQELGIDVLQPTQLREALEKLAWTKQMQCVAEEEEEEEEEEQEETEATGVDNEQAVIHSRPSTALRRGPSTRVLQRLIQSTMQSVASKALAKSDRKLRDAQRQLLEAQAQITLQQRRIQELEAALVEGRESETA